MSILLLIVAFAVILAGCELFVNGIEWFGRKLNLGEGAVGSVLAAVGTALPETIIPLIAILIHGGAAGEEVGIGAITRFSNNVVGDAWVGTKLESDAICITAGVSCPKMGVGVASGFALKY